MNDIGGAAEVWRERERAREREREKEREKERERKKKKKKKKVCAVHVRREGTRVGGWTQVIPALSF